MKDQPKDELLKKIENAKDTDEIIKLKDMQLDGPSKALTEAFGLQDYGFKVHSKKPKRDK